MNLRLWFLKLFQDHHTNEDTANVRNTGKADGQMLTNAYADGFFEGVGEVLHARLHGFHQVIETTSMPVTTVKKLGAKRK